MSKILAISFAVMLLAVGMAEALPRPVLVLAMVPFCAVCVVIGRANEQERARKAQGRKAQ